MMAQRLGRTPGARRSMGIVDADLEGTRGLPGVVDGRMPAIITGMRLATAADPTREGRGPAIASLWGVARPRRIREKSRWRSWDGRQYTDDFETGDAG